MPLAATVLLVATALVILGLAVRFITIVILLLRISGALARASAHLGVIPEQLEPLGPVMGKLTGSMAAIRMKIDR